MGEFLLEDKAIFIEGVIAHLPANVPMSPKS